MNLIKESKLKSGFFSSCINESNSKDNYSSLAKLIINNNFIMTQVIPVNPQTKSAHKYKIYKGVDTSQKKYVIIYVFPVSKSENVKSKGITKSIREELKEKIAPSIIWKGTQKIDNNSFIFQIHQKFGPSLADIMSAYKKKISEKTLYVMTYQLLKLLDKIDNAGYSTKTLSPYNLIFSESAFKTSIYLLNAFDLEKKGEETSVTSISKYSSLGSCLKLKNRPKDMVESMCYILIDFYEEGQLFSNCSSVQEYFQQKSILCPNFMPYHFLQFYNYVKNSNHSEEIKFSQWKLFFKKLAGENLSEPYEWINIPSDLSKKVKGNKQKKIDSNDYNFNFLKEFQIVQQLGQEQSSVKFQSSQDCVDFQQYLDNISVEDKISEFKLITHPLGQSKKYM